MLSLFRIFVLFCCLVFLLILAFHFFSPEKDLVTGSILRFRIKVGALVNVLVEESWKSYEKIWGAKSEDRFNTLQVEGKNLWQKFFDNGKKNSFIAYLVDLKTMTGNLLSSVKNEIHVLSSAGTPKARESIPVSVGDYSRAVQIWLAINEKRLNAIRGIDGDESEAKEKAELERLQGELRAVSQELEKLVNLSPEARSGPSVTMNRPSDSVQVQEKPSTDLQPALSSASDIQAAPDMVLSMFKDRYLSHEIRKTPYFFKKLRVLKSAQANIPGVYCISFSADVHHNHDKKKWDRSPVVLNVIVSLGGDGVMSSYENFAKNPWEYPVSGACVKPIWGVHEFVWDDVCPYGCMDK
jgi:hypothetical protein